MDARSTDPANDEFTFDIESNRLNSHEFNLGCDPSTDLHAFVNSRWGDTAEIPPGYACWDNFAALHETTLRQQAVIARQCAGATSPGEARIVDHFWTAAMRTCAADVPQSSVSLDRELRRIDALDDQASIAAYLRDVHANGQRLLFTIDAQPDYQDPNWMIAYVIPASLGLPDREQYFSTTPAGLELRRDYRAHISTMLGLSGSGTADTDQLAERIIELETHLASVSVSRRELARNITLRYNPLSITEAERLDSGFGWRRYFGSQRLCPERFSLAIPAFHVELGVMLRDLPAATWRGYLRYRQFDDAAPYLGGEAWRAHTRFHWLRLRGAQTAMPCWKRALISLNEHVGEAMGRLYAARFCPDPAQADICDMVENLRAAFEHRIQAVQWMSASTKRAALVKLRHMRSKVGKPSQWRDWSGLVLGRDNWYENIRAARRFNHRWQTRLVNRPVDSRLWTMTPQTVNARYDPTRNEIIVPAALLQAPLFDPRADIAANYGRIGAIVAHEMTHGFDDQGSRFGPDGRLENWWTDADRARFKARGQRLVKAVNEWTATGEPVDGELTLGENIADMGGLAIAADALHNCIESRGKADPMIAGFTRMQWLFIAWAALWRQKMSSAESRLRRAVDTHAPGTLRANFPAVNNRRFDDAFPADPATPPAKSELGIW